MLSPIMVREHIRNTTAAATFPHRRKRAGRIIWSAVLIGWAFLYFFARLA